jgi:hypothetical protein
MFLFLVTDVLNTPVDLVSECSGNPVRLRQLLRLCCHVGSLNIILQAF